MNIGQNPTISNGSRSQQLAQFIIVPHSKLYMPRNNPVLLVIPRSISSKFQQLSSKILKNSREINRWTGTNSLSITTLLQKPSNSTYGELETCLLRSGGGFWSFLGFSSTCHGFGCCGWRHIWWIWNAENFRYRIWIAFPVYFSEPCLLCLYRVNETCLIGSFRFHKDRQRGNPFLPFCFSHGTSIFDWLFSFNGIANLASFF